MMRAINMESIFYGAALAALLFCVIPNIANADDIQPAAANTPPLVQTKSPAVAGNPAQTTAAAPDTKNVPVTEVVVTAAKPKAGSEEVGYKVENTTTTGLWGEMKIQDTPYSINVMSSDLIENVQAGSRSSSSR